MTIDIELLSHTIVIVAGLFLIVYGFIFYHKHPEYKISSYFRIILGVYFLTLGLLYLLEVDHWIGAVLFFGGIIIFLLIIMFIYKEKLERESTDLIIDKIKEVREKKRLDLFDIFKGRYFVKLFLKRGPDYAAKVMTLVMALTIASINTVLYYFQGSGIRYLVCNFSILFFGFGLLFYFTMRKKLRKVQYKYNQLRSNEEKTLDKYK